MGCLEDQGTYVSMQGCFLLLWCDLNQVNGHPWVHSGFKWHVRALGVPVCSALHMCVHRCANTLSPVCTHTHTHVSIYMHSHKYTQVCAHMRMHAYMCTHVCVCVCVWTRR